MKYGFPFSIFNSPFSINMLVCAGVLLFRVNSLPAQDPDIQADEQDALEHIYRTSEEPEAIPTNRRQREDRAQEKRVSVPRGAFRVGCTCMDGFPTPTRSLGACSGHGGVRFWLYRTVEGDTVRVLTGRHERHPQPLDAAEMSSMAQHRAQRSQSLHGTALAPPVVLLPAPAEHALSWDDAALWSGAGIALFFILRLLLTWISQHENLVRYALRHLLRPGRRPAARKRRQNPRPPRL